jgi:hypothetical protein
MWNVQRMDFRYFFFCFDHSWNNMSLMNEAFFCCVELRGYKIIRTQPRMDLSVQCVCFFLWNVLVCIPTQLTHVDEFISMSLHHQLHFICIRNTMQRDPFVNFHRNLSLWRFVVMRIPFSHSECLMQWESVEEH